ncbi:MAG TPA: hypothetical protein VGB82_14125 [Alphaproteobacteria bacterium]
MGTIDRAGSLKVVDALGRSDWDLAHALRQYVGRSSGFLFRAVPSAAEAFAVECDLYHQLRRFDLPHPVRPSGTTLTCSICGGSGNSITASAATSLTRRPAAERAESYRLKAAEIRVTAADMHQEAKDRLLQLADAYERLAKTTDTMIELESKKPKNGGSA